MKGFFNHLDAWLHRKETEKFTELNGDTAVRVTGEISINPSLTVGSFLVTNVTAAVSGTEYTLTLPVGVKRFEMKARGIAKIQLSNIAGQSGINFRTINPGEPYKEENIKVTIPIVFYFQTNKDNEVIELTTWYE